MVSLVGRSALAGVSLRQIRVTNSSDRYSGLARVELAPQHVRRLAAYTASTE